MFRVTIRGKFKDLDPAGRAAVTAAGGVGYTEAGAFTHDPAVTVFTFRCEVPAGPDDDEDDATLRALDKLEAHGHPYEILKVAVTDMREIRVRQKPRTR